MTNYQPYSGHQAGNKYSGGEGDVGDQKYNVFAHHNARVYGGKDFKLGGVGREKSQKLSFLTRGICQFIALWERGKAQ